MKNETPDFQKVFSLEETAQILRVSRFTVRRYLKTGQLKGARVGKYWRITETSINELLEHGTEINYLKKLQEREDQNPDTPDENPETVAGE